MSDFMQSGQLFRKKVNRDIPTSANIIVERGVRYAVWVSGKKIRKELCVETPSGLKARIESKIYVARYTDSNGVRVERSTGCCDRRAAENVLNNWLNEVQKLKSGIISYDEKEYAGNLDKRIDDFLEDFIDYQRGTCKPSRIKLLKSYIPMICKECNFVYMRDLRPHPLIRYLNKKKAHKVGARTLNSYREPMMTFANWAVKTKILRSNPLSEVPKANEDIDRRHDRRALSPDEILKLLKVAQERPTHDVTLIRSGPNKGKNLANVRASVLKEKAHIGLERKIIYATFIYTGLRKSELASINIGQVFLDDDTPHIVLFAVDEKGQRGAKLPIHSNLLPYLREWLEFRKSIGTLQKNAPLFKIPNGLHKIMTLDLKLAGIEKQDILNRFVDIHALRHTHGTLLAKSGVPIQTVQKSMRHKRVATTLKFYTHLDLEDVAKAVSVLPDFLGQAEKSETQN